MENSLVFKFCYYLLFLVLRLSYFCCCRYFFVTLCCFFVTTCYFMRLYFDCFSLSRGSMVILHTLYPPQTSLSSNNTADVVVFNQVIMKMSSFHENDPILTRSTSSFSLARVSYRRRATMLHNYCLIKFKGEVC